MGHRNETRCCEAVSPGSPPPKTPYQPATPRKIRGTCVGVGGATAKEGETKGRIQRHNYRLIRQKTDFKAGSVLSACSGPAGGTQEPSRTKRSKAREREEKNEGNDVKREREREKDERRRGDRCTCSDKGMARALSPRAAVKTRRVVGFIEGQRVRVCASSLVWELCNCS